MSKEQKVETGITIGAKASEDDKLLGTVKIDDSVVTWEALDASYTDLAKDIVKQQYLIIEMAKSNETAIGADKELSTAVIGLTQSLGDLAKECVAVRSKHTGLGVGPIDKEDEDNITLYIQCEHEYVSIGEKYLNLSSVAVLDIFTRLQVDTTGIKKLQKDIEKDTTHGK